MKTATVVVAVVLGALGLNHWHVLGRLNADAPDAADAAIHVTGQVQPRTRVAISSSLSLPIVELPVREGDRVVRRGDRLSPPVPGSVLARLDDSCLKAALRCAEAKRDAQAAELEAARLRLTALESQVASSQASLAEAERNWGRYKPLANTDVVSQTESDGAHCKYDRVKAEHDATVRGYTASKASLDVLEKNLRAAEADVERARLDLAKTTITSPIDGVVTRLNVKAGEVVNGTITFPGTVLMEVADMDRMLLVARVGEESIGRLKAGQKATVHLKGCEKPLAGTVERVAIASTEDNEGTRYFKAEIALDTQGQLIPAGLTGEAAIE